MKEVDFLICGEYVLTMDGDGEPILDGAVAVSGNRIAAVGGRGDLEAEYKAQRTVKISRSVVLPGFVNTHTHAGMALLRGIADDLPLMQWLEGHIWPAENRWMSAGFVRDASKLACLEMLKAGVTAFSDMYFFQDVTAEVAREAGMRAVLGAGVIDFPTKTTTGPEDCLRKGKDFIEKWKGDDLVSPSIAPHSAFTCSPDTLRKSMELAVELDVILHTHVSETKEELKDVKERYGKTPIRLLDELGLLDKRTLAAHCVWVDEEEITLLARKGVAVSHCVESNLKLASGIAPVGGMLKAGVRVSFGTDGAASNNDLSVMGEMSTAAKLHKAVSGDPTTLSAREALMMATCWGAKATGLKYTGCLKEGNIADMIVVDLDRPHLTPAYDPYSHLVYAARPSDVRYVMVNGKMVVDNGEITTMDEAEVLKSAAEWAGKIKAPSAVS